MTLLTAELDRSQFQEISRIIYDQCGISLKSGKEALVRARLLKRLRALQIRSVKEYMELISSDKGRDEIDTLIDVMTTNKTSFFRESAHFDYLTEEILPAFTHRRLRFWSAACSSGEEPYTLAMVLREAIPAIDQKDVLILSTDISNQMLETARKGIYSKERLAGIPQAYVQKYFKRCADGAGTTLSRGFGTAQTGAAGPVESDAGVAHERPLQCHFLPECHDLFRPPDPAATGQPVLGFAGNRRVSICRTFRRLVGNSP